MNQPQKIDPRDLFTILVTQLSSSAWSQLGTTPNPMTGKSDLNLQAATLTIGILEALLFKTAGNLTKDEDKFLSESVRELRLSLAKATQGK